MVDGFFNIHPELVSAVPLCGTSDGSGIGAEILFGIHINHATTGRRGAGIITVADSAFGFFAVFPFHFGTYVLYRRQSTAQMCFAAFPAHQQRRGVWTEWDSFFIYGVINPFDFVSVFQGDICLIKRRFLATFSVMLVTFIGILPQLVVIITSFIKCGFTGFKRGFSIDSYLTIFNRLWTNIRSTFVFSTIAIVFTIILDMLISYIVAPQKGMVRSGSAFLWQMNSSVEESSISLGVSPMKAYAMVTPG